jgi:hypothetical protein
MATRKLFRCNNPKCQAVNKGKFQSEKPECPQCKIGADHPKFGSLILRLVMVHYDPPSEMPGISQWVRACDKSKSIAVQDGGGVPNPWHAGTGLIQAVTCPECMATAEFKASLAQCEDEDFVEKAAAATASIVQNFVQPSA